MSDRVQGVSTKQGRDITALVNRSARPVALLGMFFGENSSLDEASRRDMGGCDVSGNLPHISICRAVEDGLVPAGDKAAFWRWTADTPVVLDTARAWFETLIAWAERTLGAPDPRVNLLCCCWWNAPNAGAVTEARTYGEADPRTRRASAEYWLADNLKARPSGVKYAANRQNYIRGLEQAEHYRVQEEPMNYAIGPGVQDAMRQYADEPKGDEVYLPDGTTSVTPGRDRLYFYSKASNEVYIAPKA